MRQLAEWESLPHNYENYFFLCLHSSNRHVNVDLWLLDEQQSELLSELTLSFFSFTVCKALCLAHLRQITLSPCFGVLIPRPVWPDLWGRACARSVPLIMPPAMKLALTSLLLPSAPLRHHQLQWVQQSPAINTYWYNPNPLTIKYKLHKDKNFQRSLWLTLLKWTSASYGQFFPDHHNIQEHQPFSWLLV